MAEQSKKEIILDERSASSIELKDSSTSVEPMLPSAPVRDEIKDIKPLGSPAAKSPDSVSEASGSNEPTDPASDRNPNDEQADGETSSEGDDLRSLSPFQRTQITGTADATPRTSGLRRHRLVMSACCLFSVGFLGLCALDLKSAFTTQANVDKSFKLSYPAKRPALPPNLTYLSESEQGADGLYRVVEATWTSSNVGLVDKNGVVVVKPQYATIGPFQDGLAAVSQLDPYKIHKNHNSYSPESYLYGYIDKTGKVIVKPQYENARAFRDGVALVLTDSSHTKLIDRTGKVLFDAETQHMAIDLGGIYAVTEKHGRTGLIDKNGKRLLPQEYDGITSFDSRNQNQSYNQSYDPEVDQEPEKFFQISRDGKCGVIDFQGKIIIPPTFHEILSYQNGHATIGMDGKYGFADSSGKIVIKPTYDFVTAYDDLIAVKEGAKWKLINSSGNTVNGAHIDGVIVQNGERWLVNGRAPVIIGDLCGFLDKNGLVAIKPTFVWELPFKNGFSEVYDGKLWRFIDILGRSPNNLKFTGIAKIPMGAVPVPVSLEGPLYGFGMSSQIMSTNQFYKNSIKSMKRISQTDASDNDSE
jgi:hypothetical protein